MANKKDDKRNSDERRFAQVAPETIQLLSESIGIPNLSPDISRSLSEDASYRARELSSICAQFMRHGRKKKLSLADMNRAMKWYNAKPVYGNTAAEASSSSHNLSFVPEVELYATDDDTLNLNDIVTGNNTQKPRNLEPTVEASWLSIEGTLLNTNEDGRVVEFPQLAQMSPMLLKYYNMVTSVILNEPESSFKIVVKDVQSNPKLSPLLPMFITFVRSGLQRHQDNKTFVQRLLRFLQAFSSNPLLNFSPKPYLSHLVTALLSTLIPERSASIATKQNGPHNNSVRTGTANRQLQVKFNENVSLASFILSYVLNSWSTPVNQLKAQTHRALKDSLKELTIQSTASQYGAIYALTILGPKVLEENFLPIIDNYSSNLIAKLLICQDEDRKRILSTLFGIVVWAARSVLYNRSVNAEKTCDASLAVSYSVMQNHFGDALAIVPLPRLNNLQIPDKEIVGKLRIKGLGSNQQQGVNGIPPPTKRSRKDPYGSSHRYSTAADMNLPNDIFEPMEDSDFSVTTRYLQTKPDTTPKKLSDNIKTCFETSNREKTVSRYKNININFGRALSRNQLSRKKFQVPMKLFDPKQKFSSKACIGNRMNFPRSTERFKKQSLESCNIMTIL